MSYKDPTKQSDYQRRWIANRRANFFADKSCVTCGATKNLELDHINPADKTSHKIWSWAKKRREAEIAKCQVLCTECHKAKTYEQRSHKAQHGRGGMYKKGCRCFLCVEWNRERTRAYRARKKLEAVA